MSRAVTPLSVGVVVERTWSVGLSWETCSLVNPVLSIRVSLETPGRVKVRKRTGFVSLVRRLVDDCTVLEATQIEHPYTSIRTTAHEYINALGTESHVEHFLVMGDELRLRGKSRNVPDSAGSVYTGSDDETR